MAPLRDLELMIQSHYPLIGIETFEEARLDFFSACRAQARRWSRGPSPASGSCRASRWRRGALRQVHRRVGEEPRQGPAHGRADGALRSDDRRAREGAQLLAVGDSDAGLSKRIFGRLLG